MLTVWEMVVPIALAALAISAWLVLRDPTPSSPPGRHRQPHRDPHDPIRRDDEPPPDQT